jgi:hypothetical protein
MEHNLFLCLLSPPLSLSPFVEGSISWSLLRFHHPIMFYKASFVFQTEEIKFPTIKGVECEHKFFYVQLKCIV